jgi:hypothetical protein
MQEMWSAKKIVHHLLFECREWQHQRAKLYIALDRAGIIRPSAAEECDCPKILPHGANLFGSSPHNSGSTVIVMIVLLSMSHRYSTVILHRAIQNCFVDLAILQDRLLAFPLSRQPRFASFPSFFPSSPSSVGKDELPASSRAIWHLEQPHIS